MAHIRTFIQEHLLEPLKQYPTIIQNTMVEIITQRLEELYELSFRFPEIISPNQYRLDILKAIADQFLFTVRDDADLREQIAILDKILYVYNRRGSVDTIENMWKYYGGDLPKDVRVHIPSYNLFRYSISPLSGTHVFQDNTRNRTGVYEIELINNTYPIPDLKEFLIKELVAAGNYIYFTNTIHSDLVDGESPSHFKYLVNTDNLLHLQLEVSSTHAGLRWSTHNEYSGITSILSGKGSIYVNLTHILEMETRCNRYIPAVTFTLGPYIESPSYEINPGTDLLLDVSQIAYYTSMDKLFTLDVDMYDRQGNPITSRYPGYFIVGETLLGEEIS